MSAPRARFDDLRPGHRRSFEMTGWVRTLVARRPDEVPAVLAEVEQAVAGGLWAAGLVAYDAAPGLDPALVVAGGGTTPPAWFGLFEGRGPATDLSVAGGAYDLGEWRPSVDAPGYRAAVERIRHHIAAGDTYQVNYTMRLRAPFAGSPEALYADVALAQSGGYGAYLDLGDRQIASASPELFFEWRAGRIVTRPMKGTARRGRWPAEDELVREALLASEKDRAENLMIVDLLRNDLGRVAEFGSVRVDRLFEAERFDTVWQLTSTISARARPGLSLAGAFAALFPCGSVTGAPKVRTMELISELEGESRGVYCGAIGFVAPPGSPVPGAAFNVAIRTVEIAAGTATYGVGGGITWDSTGEGEHAEALVKAQVLTRARQPFELLETLRWEPGEGWWWLDLHLDRLESSAHYFGFRFDRARTGAALDAAVGGEEALRVRLVANRAGGVRVEAAPAPPAGQPVTVAVDDEPVDPASPWLYHKTTRRALYQAARARHPGTDDVLLVNPTGEVTESTVANLVARFGARWVTPPVTSGCLPGVHRRALLEAGEVAEGPITVADLRAADEVALVNSVRGRMPVVLAGSAGG